MRVDLIKSLPRWIFGLGATNFVRSSNGLAIDYTKFHVNMEGDPVDADGNKWSRGLEKTHLFDAQMISSKFNEGAHMVLLDLDFPCQLIETSTPGHYHLYMNKMLSEPEMDKLVTVLVEVGILNPGIKKLQWDVDKQLTLRLPWVKKGEDKSYNEQQEQDVDATVF